MSIHNTAAAASLISRVGKECDIQRGSTSGTDAYLNPNTSWSSVGSETVARIYPYIRLWAEQEDTLAGEINEDDPILLFRRAADIEDGDKVVWHAALPQSEQITYRVRSITQLPTHSRARSQKV